MFQAMLERYTARAVRVAIVLACAALVAGIVYAYWPASPLCQGLASLKDLQTGRDVEVCDYFSGRKAVLVVNTASSCDFTPQFRGLQALYERYEAAGLEIVGVPSDDFGGQEFPDSERTAQVCYRDYNVTFPMVRQVDIVGADAHPLFLKLASAAAKQPHWNFHKYLVTPKSVYSFDSEITPDDTRLRSTIEAALRSGESF